MNHNRHPDPHDVIHEALLSQDIQVEHSPQSLVETGYWLENDGLDDPALSDLTMLPFVTIDNEDSRDLDQALYITKLKEGYRVFYALADASYYIRPDSALFAEALHRGTTYYTPVLAAAMLPTDLSEGLISLNPDVLRRALVFDISMDVKAVVTNCSIVRAKIQSQAKLSYAGVQQWLDSDSADSENYHPSLRLLQEVGSKLIAAGEARGVIRFDRTEPRIEVRGTPPHLQASLRTRFDTERYNEQISLLCNMQGAELLLGFAGVTDVLQAIYRVHEAPLRKNLSRLKETLNAFANACSDPDTWRWHDGQSLAEYVDSLPDDLQNRRRVRAVQRQIMQAQRGSTFTPEPGEHHALKACSYARFSSPMREVVGIFTHKELLEALNGGKFDNEADDTLRDLVIDSANAARQKQRQLDKHIELATLRSVFQRDLDSDVTSWHTGTIMGMRTDKIYINLDDMALDIKVYRDDLENTQATSYTISEATAVPADETLPSWQLGQEIHLRVRSYDTARTRFVFDIQAL
ncbi:MAG: ribonuclease catalytic domain-containing protein [Granulosicoccus sp.]